AAATTCTRGRSRRFCTSIPPSRRWPWSGSRTMISARRSAPRSPSSRACPPRRTNCAAMSGSASRPTSTRARSGWCLSCRRARPARSCAARSIRRSRNEKPRGRAAGSVAQRLQPRLHDAGQLAPEPLVLALLLGGAPVTPVGEIRALQRVGRQVIHLPLVRPMAVGVVVPGDLVAVLTDADDVVRRVRVGTARLPGLPVIVGKDRVVLRWPGWGAQDLVG